MDVLKRLKKLQSEYGWSDYRIAKKPENQSALSELLRFEILNFL